MTYTEVLDYLLQQLPMFQRVGAAAYRADLGNIIKLCDAIGNPQKDLKCIHIAGTNGKGSVAHIISSVLQAQGYKVGTFTSPHYKDYRERIKINGELITEEFITGYVNQYYHEFIKTDASFFEITTAMMFAYFKDMQTDYCIIETGMGGRLDSTNIIVPLLSVITNISFDHQQFLGDTLPKIAAEKAGIIKHATPVVIGETNAETAQVFKGVAALKSAPIKFADTLIEIQDFQQHVTGISFSVYLNGDIWLDSITSDINGSYQQKNVITSLAALVALQQQGVVITDTAIKDGLAHVATSTRFIGRWMVRQKNPLVVFDSAHNEGGLRELFTHLHTSAQLHIVYGTVADKDLSMVFTILPKSALYYFCKADIPRGKDAIELYREAMENGLKGAAYNTVKEALASALNAANESDIVLLTGSVFVVADAL